MSNSEPQLDAHISTEVATNTDPHCEDWSRPRCVQ